MGNTQNMKNKNFHNVICITPLDHLPSVVNTLKKNSNFYYKPNIKKNELKKLLLSNNKINSIFCNPNKQGYILDYSLLKNTHIKFINTASTGTNHIDIIGCKKLKIKIFSLKNDKKLINQLSSTSELALTLMMALLKNLVKSYNFVKSKKKWDYTHFIGQEISSLTIGIIGMGRLGTFMAKYCSSLGMRVLINDKFKISKNFENTNLNEIARRSDVISLHVHLKEDTFHLLDKNFFLKCKKKPIIINTSRGDVVNEKDLIQSLRSNKISGYGTDVISHELSDIKKSPIIKNLNKLNIIITPHLGGMTYQGQKKAYEWAAKKFLFTC